MRTSLALLAGLGLTMAACAPGAGRGPANTPPVGSAFPTPGVPTAETGTISPIEGQSETAPRSSFRGVPSAQTGTISPIEGQNSTAPRSPFPGVPSARSGTISPIEGQSDRGPGAPPLTPPM